MCQFKSFRMSKIPPVYQNRNLNFICQNKHGNNGRFTNFEREFQPAMTQQTHYNTITLYIFSIWVCVREFFFFSLSFITRTDANIYLFKTHVSTGCSFLMALNLYKSDTIFSYNVLNSLRRSQLNRLSFVLKQIHRSQWFDIELKFQW